MLLVAADPNWFYSTLAQSTAALVGLAGGFLAQRLLTLHGEIGPKREALRRKALAEMAAMKSLGQSASAVLDCIEVVLQEAEERDAAGSDRFKAKRLKFLPRNSLSIREWGNDQREIETADGVGILKGAADALRELKSEADAVTWHGLTEDLRQTGELRAASASWLDVWPNSVDPPDEPWELLKAQRPYAAEQWVARRRALENRGAELASFQQGLVPQSFYWLLGILIGLLGAGLIAPLTYLSAEPGNSKCVLLWLFIPLAVAFLVFYGWELRRLRRADRLDRRGY